MLSILETFSMCDMSNYTLLHPTLYLLFIDPTSIHIYTVNDKCDLLFDSASHVHPGFLPN